MTRKITLEADTPTDSELLRDECSKLRCLAHLVEGQEELMGSPLNMEEINRGLALVLCQAADRIQTVSDKLEEAEVRKASRTERGNVVINQ